MGFEEDKQDTESQSALRLIVLIDTPLRQEMAPIATSMLQAGLVAPRISTRPTPGGIGSPDDGNRNKSRQQPPCRTPHEYDASQRHRNPCWREVAGLRMKRTGVRGPGHSFA